MCSWWVASKSAAQVAVQAVTLTRRVAQARRRKSKPLLSEEAISLITVVKLMALCCALGLAFICLSILVWLLI